MEHHDRCGKVSSHIHTYIQPILNVRQPNVVHTAKAGCGIQSSYHTIGVVCALPDPSAQRVFHDLTGGSCTSSDNLRMTPAGASVNCSGAGRTKCAYSVYAARVGKCGYQRHLDKSLSPLQHDNFSSRRNPTIAEMEGARHQRRLGLPTIGQQ